MTSILLLVEHQQNRQLLAKVLEPHYQVLCPEIDADFATAGTEILKLDFDLCFMDYTAIHLLRPKIVACREAAVPNYLPFVFLTSIQDVGFSTDHLEPLVDSIIHLPVNKLELQTKIRVLLRSRSYSLQLQVTQEKLNRSLAKEKELNKIKSSFVSKVSHDFRNPLNSISGMAQVLEAYGDKLPPKKKAEVLQQLKRNVDKMTCLLNDVLTISQKDMGKLQFNANPLELEKLCRGIINEVQTAFDSKQTINFVYQAERTKYSLDYNLLNYILTNLLTNAYKYSPPASVIDLIVRSQSDDLIFVVRDRGMGIPASELPLLFNSFYRASNSKGYQGTGLGLAIAKEYAEFHQGTISVESELEVGTTFTVTIPIDDRSEITPP